ncbi:MAG TPA: TIGR00725 family protein [Anaerolineae bacterium]|nr:TIGR00725 family protein [Anaerolineae bacterium]
MMRVPMIGVLGTAATTEAVPTNSIECALEVGREIARSGAICVSGGMSGVMNAASKGARSLGGIVVGIAPGLERGECSPYLTVAIMTGLGTVRNVVNVRAPDSLIAIGGGFGTLNELLIAYEDHKPAIVIEGSGGWSDRLRSVLLDETYFDDQRKAPMYFVRTPAEAVALALKLSGEPLPSNVQLHAPQEPAIQPPHIGVLTPDLPLAGEPLEDVTLESAGQVGRLLAERGAVTICDPGQGAQARVSQGAAERGGIVASILGSMSKADANNHVMIPVRTGLGKATYSLPVRASDALIVVGGDAGVLNQLTLCYFHSRPVVILRNSGSWANRLPDLLWEGKYLDWRKNIEFHFAQTPEQAVDLAMQLGYKPPSQIEPKYDVKE